MRGSKRRRVYVRSAFTVAILSTPLRARDKMHIYRVDDDRNGTLRARVPAERKLSLRFNIERNDNFIFVFTSHYILVLKFETIFRRIARRRVAKEAARRKYLIPRIPARRDFSSPTISCKLHGRFPKFLSLRRFDIAKKELV